MTRIVRSEKGVQRTILLMILVSVVIATISLAGILNLYFAGAPSSQISTSVVASMPGDQLESPPSTSTIGASSILSTNGLRLTASISSAEVKVTQNLNISVSLFNTLPTVSSVPPSNLTSFQGFPIALWPTCFGYPPVAFVVLSGNYSLDALRADANATGSSPSVACAEYGMKYGMIINNLVFQPSSDQATLTGVFVTAVGSDLNATRGPYRLTSNFTVDGYWSYPFNSSEDQDLLTPVNGGPGAGFVYPETGPIATHPFVTGRYTLVVEDEWGQVELLHFTVVPVTSTLSAQIGLPTTSSVITSNPEPWSSGTIGRERT